MRITKPIITLFLMLLMTLPCGSALAQLSTSKAPLKHPISAYRLDEDTVVLTLTIGMEPDWYTYGNIPGGTGKPTVLSGSSAEGSPITPLYPKGVRKPDSFDPSTIINAYKDGTILFAVVPAQTAEAFPVSLRLELLLCHPTRCIPVRRDFTFGDPAMPMGALPLAQNQPWWQEFDKLYDQTPSQSDTTSVSSEITPSGDIEWNFSPTYLQPALEVGSLLSAILMGLLAGLILNIMPCVLPVISLKLSALLNSTSIDNEVDRVHAFREHNIFFILGILTFFMVLATALGASGQAWGALFQKQWLVILVALVVLVLSLSLFGLFHLPVVDLRFGTESKSPRVQAFFTGNLTTLLATPCSGPFLGGVLSWALVQGPTVIFTVFASIGIGMSFPYVLLAINPRLSRFLPKPGPWIQYVEKGIAFFLVGTAFYLLSLAFGGDSPRIFATLWGVILFGWIWKRTMDKIPSKRLPARFAGLIVLAALVFWTTPTKYDEVVWEDFDTKELSKRIGEEYIFVDFTADWCPTCKVLEATVLTHDNILRWKKQYGITFIKVDLTERNMEGESLLQALGSMSIPTAAFFTPGPESNSPMVLRDLFTQSQLENILKSWKK